MLPTVQQLPRKKYKSIMLILGSIIALIGSFCTWPKGRKFFYIMANKIFLELRFNVLAIKEICCDLREAKCNKIELSKKTGCVAIVTGGSRGIGHEIVKMLLKCDMEVIIACRNVTAGKKSIRDIRESGIKEGMARTCMLDNSSFESVKAFAENMKKDYKKIDILINNAGIMFVPYDETKEGYEQQWGVNYLSHFLLTALLLPLLRNSAETTKIPARVINVSSCAHQLGIINFDDINYKKQYLSSAAYAQSKLASVMFTITLQRLFNERKIRVQTHSVHPGIVNTDLFHHTFIKNFKVFAKLLFKTPEQGAITPVYAAISKTLENTGGLYLSNCQSAAVLATARDEALGDRLFMLSLEQVGLKDFFENL